MDIAKESAIALYDKMKKKERSHLNEMPVNPRLYPDNWNNLALEVKEAAHWQCQS
jgi:hypothetical protein